MTHLAHLLLIKPMFQNLNLIKYTFAFLIVCIGITPNVWARDIDCEALAENAEIQYAIPSGIMQGIARVESGRVGLDGKRRSWPWTVNDGVEGLFFEDQDSAVEFVEVSYANGENSVDVGCMQINTKWHKDNFHNFAEMFDPDINVAYAASFLIILRDRHGSWDQAIRHYHSNDPRKNERYLRKVHDVMQSENHILPSKPQLMNAVLKVPPSLPTVKPKPKPKINVKLPVVTQPKTLPLAKSKMKIGLKTLVSSKISEATSDSVSVVKKVVNSSPKSVDHDHKIHQAMYEVPKKVVKSVNAKTLPTPVIPLSSDDLLKKRQPHIAKNWRKVLEFRASFAKLDKNSG